ncbi:MAG: hypothetical protein Q7S92_05920 [Candidatus Diapherotrites archaeon]|nr:hypothetical protein [Candidatus Diapherotrites archaeon]
MKAHNGLKLIAFIILAGLLVITAFANTALIYSFILFCVFASLHYLRRQFKPEKISAKEFAELEEKFEKYTKWIDLASIVFVLIEASIIYFIFSSIKDSFFTLPATVLFASNPQGELFLAGFLIALGTSGWIIEFLVNLVFGKKYWQYYYNTEYVKMQTRKVYHWISIISLIIAMPVLFIGFQSHASISSEGIYLNTGLDLETKYYSWNEIQQIEKHSGQEQEFYVVRFENGKKWNTSNEKWNQEQTIVMNYISARSQKMIKD